MKKSKIYLIVFVLLSFSNIANALDRRGRLGLGYSNELQNNLPTLSLKLQKNKSFGFGAILNFSNKETGGGFGAGVKLYKYIFDEPQLNFYASLLGALIKKNISGVSKSGFETDFALGTEFHFQDLSSIGFSFEFGLSLYSLDKFVIQTMGNSIIGAGVHFYL